jgi:hypothetical protein
MNISIAQAVACRNILALKDFNTFLFNYQLHESPNFVEKQAIKAASGWLNRIAMKFFNELRSTELEKLTVKLADCKTEMYSVLHVATDRKAVFDSATDLFRVIADTNLEFDKIKTPKEDTAYLGDEVTGRT